MLEKLIAQLSQDLAMEELITTPDQNHYHLPFAKEIEIEAIELEKSFLFKGIIGERPKENGDAFLLKALEANLFGIGTRGASIGMNEEGKLLTLSLELDYNSSYKDFKEKLEDFVSVIDFWRNEASNHR
jgi:hypothetical protein